MALIVKYKFQNVDANGNSVSLLPQFPSGVSYTKTDVVEGNITTRTVETDDLSKVTYIRFGCNEGTYVTGAWEYLTEILDINISYVNTSYRMFRGCKLLNKLDTSDWDTSKFTQMEAMFLNCSQLTQLDVSNWDTSKVQYMNNMFQSCSQLTQLDLSNWDTSNVTSMQSMFRNCSLLTQLDLSNFDTSKVTNMQSMFYSCSQLTQLDLSNFDTSKVTNMSNMFYNCNVKNVGLIYCSKDTIDNLANCITSPCNFYVTNKAYTSPNPLVKYVMYREDKKRILYYNEETDTWEKPILRQWDSIEKHSDGKYYYHKRSGEVVLNGNEFWELRPQSDSQDVIAFNGSGLTTSSNVLGVICDKFPTIEAFGEGANFENIFIATSTRMQVRILKTKLSSQDVAGFKQWLKANPTTVVYQLAEEKVYECTNLDLITYADETNLMVKGGAIVPKTTLKVHKNIANIATILQEKVNRLENNVGHVNGEIDNINNDLTNLTESIEGSSVSVVSKDGYLKDIEIIGNTIQNQDNLADIRSVGDKLENQELYEIPVLCTGKNLLNVNRMESGHINWINGLDVPDNTRLRSSFISIPSQAKALFATNEYGLSVIKGIIYYDKNKTYITCQTDVSSFTVPDTAKYIRVVLEISEGTDICISNEEVYEPYQEDKLTILSPVQLEKVGNVADRIIYKDGVWGIEKNIETLILNGGENWRLQSVNKKNIGNFETQVEGISYTNYISSIPKQTTVISETDSTGIYINYEQYLFVRLENITTIAGCIEYLKNQNVIIKYQLAQPTFIPLPHDQQVKLRTFANKTNIHFLTEIKPTLKASVPKSLSATVSTHSEQIDNLGKELDKVKKLEESVASEVVTKSDFTTVENTSNGYFEDVKIEGRTLVNLYPKLDANNYTSLGATLSNDTITINANGTWRNLMLKKDLMPLKTSTYYTFVIYIIDNTITGNDTIIHFGDTLPNDPSKFRDSYHFALKNKKGIYAFKLKTKDSFDNVIFDTRDHLIDKATSGTIVFKYMILEGDHTQNPPEFFEGIKSVGQDVDEISVLSCNGNLYNVDSMVDGKYLDQITGEVVSLENRSCSLEYIPITKNTLYFNQYEPIEQLVVHCYDTNKTRLKCITTGKNTSQTLVLPEGTTFIRLAYAKLKAECRENGIYLGSIDINYEPHQSDKKPILYYNPTTNTWEKPVLRQLDSIEKHSDGKYYYHKRSGEVVLDGSESWSRINGYTIAEITSIFRFRISEVLKGGNFVCDIFKRNVNLWNEDIEGIHAIENSIDIRINKSRIGSTVDTDMADEIALFKQWLQANPTTVVYQLAEEKVYECTSIDLITYENETNFIVNTGAITPKSTLKVMCNINNVVRELQQKVSNLENYIQHVMIDALNNALNE